MITDKEIFALSLFCTLADVKEYSETDYDEVINETGVHDKLFYGRSREDIDMARDLEALKKEGNNK